MLQIWDPPLETVLLLNIIYKFHDSFRVRRPDKKLSKSYLNIY